MHLSAQNLRSYKECNISDLSLGVQFGVVKLKGIIMSDVQLKQKNATKNGYKMQS